MDVINDSFVVHIIKDEIKLDNKIIKLYSNTDALCRKLG